MNDPKQILVERDGHMARVTINRPERRNAISQAAWQSLAASFDNLAVDPGVRVVVLTGAGDRAFCAGNDISEFAEKRSTPAQVDACAAEVAANAPLSIRAIKVAIGEALKPPADRDRARCEAFAAACNRSEDYREGQRAFAERRSPEFRGR